MLDSIELNVKTWDWKWQTIWTDENKEQIATLISRLDRWYYNTKKVKIHLNVFNLREDKFDCPTLFEFLTHYKLTENADISYPVIINSEWCVIDGRHRICKAILLGKKHIKGIQILDSKVI